MFGRMKPNMKPAEAGADLSAIAASMIREFPNDYPEGSDLKVDVTPLKTELTRDAKPTMLFLLAAAGFVLLIACANVANLNLSRMVRRERELGVRTAMGANRVRLFRQLLTESSLLALLGGALGLLLTTGGLQLLAAYVARFTPRAREVHIDLTVLLFTLGVALFVSVLTGTAPAVARRENLITTLKEGGSQSTLGSVRGKLRSALIVAQVAVSFLLLIGAGLTVRSLINLQHVDPGFRPENVLTIQLSLDFDRRDRPESTKVAIITQAVAQRHWHNQDPVGRRISFDNGKTWTEIVGVIGDVHEHGLDLPTNDFIYVPFAQYPQNGPALIARTQGDPMAVARTVVQRLYEVDPNQPAGRIQSLEQYRADSIAAPRLTANLLGLFALLALAIAAAGIGGVMALAVSQRTHEIGVRMAIGARPAEIVRMILSQGMGLALVGVVIGVATAFALTRAVKSFLFGVTPNDPATFLAVAAVLAAAALAACYLPARRAARVDPLRALRTE